MIENIVNAVLEGEMDATLAESHESLATAVTARCRSRSRRLLAILRLQKIFVIGHLPYRKYTDSNGVERSVTEIVADKIDLCGNRTETTTPATCEPQPSMLHDDIGDLPPSDGMPF